MSLLKRTLFTIIPLATLLIAISYGIDALFGNSVNLTYLGWTSPTGKYYANIYDFQSYIKAFDATDLIAPFINLGKAFKIILDPIQEIKKIWLDGYNLGDIFKTLEYIVAISIDFIIWLVDIVIALIQITIVIIGKLLSLFGINVYGDTELFNVFRSFTTWQLIDSVPII